MILGLGLANKHSIGFFALALVVGALLSGGWKLIANRWFVAGAAIAAAFTVPDLWWQAQHGWATIAMTQALNRENGGLGNIGTWVTGQLLMVTLALVWVWPAGLRFLWRSGQPLWRALVWAYGLLFVFFALTTGAKIYYLAGAYPALLAAGMVAIDAWLAARAGRVRTLLLAATLTTAAALPVVLPILPAADTGWTNKVITLNAETIGWPQLVQAVHKVWVSLPPAQRAHAGIFTTNYGEAGAINNLGRTDGLPTAVSGHNSEWWWGPGNPHATTIIAVGDGAATDLTGFFTTITPVATLSNPAGIHNQEWGERIYLCTKPITPWARLWPLLRHYNYVDLAGRRLHVRGDVRSEDSDRIITIDQGTANVLVAWQERQLFEALERDTRWQDSGRVFTREDGRPLRRGWASEHFGALVRRPGLPPVRFHDLRHGTATMLLAAVPREARASSTSAEISTNIFASIILFGVADGTMSGQAFFVLTALAGGPRHGYGIVGEVAELSQGRVKLKIGSLYGVLDRLAGAGLIEPDREEAHGGRLRRYYRLTPDGRSALAEEAELRAATARVVRTRLARPGPQAAG